MTTWFDLTLESHLRTFYRGVTVDDLEVTEIPGYWRIKTPCEGISKCSSPIHSTLHNEGGIRHTIYYQDRPKTPGASQCRSKLDRFRTWFEWKERCKPYSPC